MHQRDERQFRPRRAPIIWMNPVDDAFAGCGLQTQLAWMADRLEKRPADEPLSVAILDTMNNLLMLAGWDATVSMVVLRCQSVNVVADAVEAAEWLLGQSSLAPHLLGMDKLLQPHAQEHPRPSLGRLYSLPPGQPRMHSSRCQCNGLSLQAMQPALRLGCQV